MSGQEEAPTPKPVSALMQRLKSNAVAIQSRKQTGVDTPEALRFLAEDSGNVDAAGNFSLQVRFL